VEMSDTSQSGRTASEDHDRLVALSAGGRSTWVVLGGCEQFALLQWDERWDCIVLPSDTPTVDAGTMRAALHTALAHLQPGGLVAAQVPADGLDAYLTLCAGCDLRLDSCDETREGVFVTHRRSERFNIHDLVFEARATIRRCDPRELAARLTEADPPLVLDTRTDTDRRRFGVIAGSFHTPRTVLEWQLDPANGYRLPALRDFDHPLVVVCNGGYSSSLAAANLVRLGFTDVGDLRGGVHAWGREGYPLVEPDHSHLDGPPTTS
jgi:rhodanese-related sulfurtransferase